MAIGLNYDLVNISEIEIGWLEVADSYIAVVVVTLVGSSEPSNTK